MDIGPGDYVECIADSEEFNFTKGAVYCVRQVQPPRRCACVGLRFYDHADPPASDWGIRGWWMGCKFKPIERPVRDITKWVEQPTDEPALPKAPVKPLVDA